MSYALSADHGATTDSGFTPIAFGSAGWVTNLVAAAFVLNLHCIVRALLRSHWDVLANDDAITLAAVTTSGHDAQVLRRNADRIRQIVGGTSSRSIKFDVRTAATVEGPFGDRIREAVAIAASEGVDKPERALPTFESWPSAIVPAIEPPSPDTSWDYARRVRMIGLRDAEYKIERGYCQCTVCTEPQPVVVVTSRLEFDGEPTDMGGDVASLTAMPDFHHIETRTSDLLGFGWFIRRSLRSKIEAAGITKPGVLLIVRGGGFDRDDLPEFEARIAPALSELSDEGWEVHVAIGHANSKVSIRGVEDHGVPHIAAERLWLRLARG